jgi:cytochrome b561
MKRAMTSADTRTGYSAMAQVFHWATAILVVIAFVYGPGGSEQRVYSTAKDFDRQLHETLGVSVFLLTLARLAWRAFDPPPQEPPMPAWMRRSAKGVHGLLFLLLLAVPLTAVTGAWLEGHPLTFLAGLRIAPLLPEAHVAGAVIAEVHTWLGDTILWVAGFHAAVALLHHFVLRDRVLRSMLPG